MDEPLKSTGVQLREKQMVALERIAEANGVTRSAAIRAVVDAGLRARKYDDNYALDPERFARETIAEQSARATSD